MLVEGSKVLQLHAPDVAHRGDIAHHGLPLAKAVAVWFETDDFDAVVARSRATPIDGPRSTI